MLSGRAHPLHGWGRRFNPCRAHQLRLQKNVAVHCCNSRNRDFFYRTLLRRTLRASNSVHCLAALRRSGLRRSARLVRWPCGRHRPREGGEQMKLSAAATSPARYRAVAGYGHNGRWTLGTALDLATMRCGARPCSPQATIASSVSNRSVASPPPQWSIPGTSNRLTASRPEGPVAATIRSYQSTRTDEARP